MRTIHIAPSILAGDFGRLDEEAKKAEQAGADLLHLDVMDGHFVPNITFGPQAVEAISQAVSIPLDVHLMLSHPNRFVDAFIKAGADYVTVHAEAEHDVEETLAQIQSKGVKAGVALNPDKEIDLIHSVLGMCDLVLVMSVFPGFGGQTFKPEVLDKVKELVVLREQHHYRYQIEIDGGITLDTVRPAIEAGIDIAVAGTALFRAPNMQEAITQMKTMASG